MPEYPHAEITREILGAAFEIHTALGPGFLETIYEEALAHELALRGMQFQRQVRLPIYYKTAVVGTHVLDLIVDEKVIVELKAISELAEVHRAIVLSYLAATKLSAALLMNFGQPSLAYKRLVRQRQPPNK
jgi:GxxExxY protein